MGAQDRTGLPENAAALSWWPTSVLMACQGNLYPACGVSLLCNHYPTAILVSHDGDSSENYAVRQEGTFYQWI
jgi:hypothetical protein